MLHQLAAKRCLVKRPKIEKYFSCPNLLHQTVILLGETKKLKTFMFVVVSIVLALDHPVEQAKQLPNG